jgi:hypothetical protein
LLQRELALVEVEGAKDSIGDVYVISGYGKGEEKDLILKKLEEFKKIAVRNKI